MTRMPRCHIFAYGVEVEAPNRHLSQRQVTGTVGGLLLHVPSVRKGTDSDPTEVYPLNRYLCDKETRALFNNPIAIR